MSDKELATLDLCGRLSSGVIVYYEDEGGYSHTSKLEGFSYGYFKINGFDFEIDEFKPYLRPMSDMTDEEIRIYRSKIERSVGDECYRIYDYLISIHVDFRGLIQKGFALKAPKGMYKIC